MSKEDCSYCKDKGMRCEPPNTVGEPLARIVVERGGRQGIIQEPIEACTKRAGILDKINKLIASR